MRNLTMTAPAAAFALLRELADAALKNRKLTHAQRELLFNFKVEYAIVSTHPMEGASK